MKKFRLLAVMALAMIANVALAQNLRITGVVSDEAGVPLLGAVVSIDGTSNAVATDVDGIYVLQNAPSNGVITFTYAGMRTISEDINGRTDISVEMESDAVQADAVVVTALGVKRQTKSLGYAVQEIGGDDLVSARTVNVTDALDGKIAGLQIIKGSSGPGSSSKIVLRGNSSLTGSNQPLIVVDGIPMDNFTGGGVDYYGINSGTDYGSGLNDINPEDIEAFTVLKGPSAAALYGSRAGNGVILITTKSGRANSGLGITVSAGVSIQDILVKPELQNSFAQGLNGVTDNTSRTSWGAAANTGNTGKVWDTATNGWTDGTIQTYDNVGDFYRLGVVDTESVTFQQQVNRTSVYASINRASDQSMIPETNLTRTSITARASTNLGEGDKWKLDFKVNYINSQAQNRPADGISNNNPFFTLNVMPRSLSIADFENSYTEDGTQIWWDTEDNPQNNPYWVLQRSVNQDQRDRFLSFLSLSYDFTDWLKLELKGGMDYYSTFKNTKQYAGSLSSLENGYYSEQTDTFMEANYSFLLTAQKDNLFGDFGGSFSFGGNMMDRTSRSIAGNSGEFLVTNVFSLNNSIDSPTISSSNIQRKMNSLYGSLSVNWRRAIFLDATLRNDWSSTMSKDNMSFMYPSIGTSIVLSDLIDNMPSWFNFAKLRASFAQVGNDLDVYQLYTPYYVVTDATTGTNVGSRGDVLYDSDLVSELISSWEVGAEVRFFDSRLRVDAAWYKSNATNQLLNLPLDASSGYSSMMINAGNIQNEGVELSIGGSIFRNPDGFSWDAMLNVTRNVNSIISLHEDAPIYTLASIEDGITVVAREGGNYGDIYGPTYVRVTDESSQYYGQLLLDANGLPQKQNLGVSTEDAAQSYLGNQQPDALIGFNNTFSYKGFTLDLNFDARIGGEVFSLTNALTCQYGTNAATAPNGSRENLVVEGVIATYDTDGAISGYTVNTIAISQQDYYYTALGSGNIGIAEAYTYDATNVRLRTLALGYSLPQSVLSGSGFQKVNFSLTANNLWLIYSAIPGVDPEAVSGTGTNVSGLELGVAPTTRSFTFNVTLGF